MTNIEGHYSGTSGKFTCQHPGLYVFLLYIYKDVGDTTAQCYIRKNGYNMKAASSTDTASSYIAGSNAFILHLSHSDYVDVGGCTSIDTISRGWDTSFTGFLLQED